MLRDNRIVGVVESGSSNCHPHGDHRRNHRGEDCRYDAEIKLVPCIGAGCTNRVFLRNSVSYFIISRISCSIILWRPAPPRLEVSSATVFATAVISSSGSINLAHLVPQGSLQKSRRPIRQ